MVGADLTDDARSIKGRQEYLGAFLVFGLVDLSLTGQMRLHGFYFVVGYLRHGAIQKQITHHPRYIKNDKLILWGQLHKYHPRNGRYL